MSAKNVFGPLHDQAEALRWASLLREQFVKKYQPVAAAAAVLKEVATALEQAADALTAGRVNPAQIAFFARAVMSEGVALGRTAMPVVRVD